MLPKIFVTALRRPVILPVIFFLTAILLTACSTTGDKVNRLDETLRAYESAIRWAQFDAAYSFHKWDKNKQPDIPAYLKSIRVTSYNSANRTFNEKDMTARQVVVIQYYNQDDARERTLEDHQTWKYFPDQNRWYLTSMPPDFK